MVLLSHRFGEYKMVGAASVEKTPLPKREQQQHRHRHRQETTTTTSPSSQAGQKKTSSAASPSPAGAVNAHPPLPDHPHRASSSSSWSWSSMGHGCRRSHAWRYALAVAATIAVLCAFRTELGDDGAGGMRRKSGRGQEAAAATTSRSSASSSSNHPQEQGVSAVAVATTTTTTTTTTTSWSRCWDEFDESFFRRDGTRTQRDAKIDGCSCPAPSQPARRPGEPGWMEHHDRMIRHVIDRAAASTAPGGDGLDFVLLGDSITEHFNGTASMGKRPLPENREVFARHFERRDATSNAGDRALQGLALGSSGDTTMELLWHLQNGLHGAITNYLRPKLFVLLIGTNDIGRFDCSSRSVYQGIETVVDYLQNVQGPGTPILIHGLLPRSDRYGINRTDYQLGYQFRKIQQINRLLAARDGVDRQYYVDATRLFLRERRGGDAAPPRPPPPPTDDEPTMEIRADLMPDGLHPYKDGYEAWAPLLERGIRSHLAAGAGRTEG